MGTVVERENDIHHHGGSAASTWTTPSSIAPQRKLDAGALFVLKSKGPGASSSVEQHGMWSSGLPSWDPQGNINYQCRFLGNIFDFGQKVASHAAQQTAQYDAAMARTLELEQERDEWQRRSGEWERKSGEWEMQSGEWQRRSREWELKWDEAERQRLQLQADLTQSQEAFGTSNQTSLDLAAKVEKLQLDVVESGKKVEKAFILYENFKKKFGKKKKDKVPSPPKP